MTTALYRRYRPDTFDEVIGQEHVTDPLRAALRSGHINHAYLFSGPRGCGKTTSARIFARCLNCAEGPTDQPCGTCDSCQELATGGPGSLDVVEIDAASHNGVEDARDLRERAVFAPARDRFKVFILDEAHMVTTQGFNALLKLVEEPPEHVKFVFATTEPEKVIGTIRSRTHHYPFRLVPPGTLQAYMEQICAEEGVAVTPGVLPMVVRAGAGSVRDSLSVLDQLIAGTDGELDYATAAALLGFTSTTLLDDAVGAIAGHDGAALFGVVDRMISTGHDPRRFVEDLLQRLRDLIILSLAGEGGAAALGPLPADQLAAMTDQAQQLGPAAATRAAELSHAALTEMTGATSPRLQLELLCARLLLPSADADGGFAARLDALERGGGAGFVGTAHSAPGGGAGGQGGGAAGEQGRGSDAPSEAADSHAPATSGRRVDARPAPAAPAPSAESPARPSASGAADPAAAARLAAEFLGASMAADVTPPVSGAQGPIGDQAASAESPAAVPCAESPGSPTSSDGSAAAAAQPPFAVEDPAQRPDAAELSANAAPDVELSPASDPSAMREEPEAEPEVEEDAPPAPAEADTTMVRRRWGEVLEAIGRIRRTTWALVARSATVGEIRGGALYLIFETQGLVGAFRAGNHAEHVSTALRETLGVDVRIEPVTSDDLPSGGVSSGGASGSSGGVSSGGASGSSGPGGSASGDAGSPGRAGGPGRSASGQDSGGIPVPEEPPFDLTAEVPQEHSELSEPTSTPAPGEKAEPPQRANAERAATSRPAPVPEPSAHARGLQSGARVSPSSADGSGATDSPGGLGAIDEEDLPSPDDQDVVEAGLVGGPVIERVLGGRRVNESGR